MYAINMKFEKKYDFCETLDKVAVYSLWDSKADKKATYIGNGILHNRIPAHIKNFNLKYPLTCYAGFRCVTGCKKENDDSKKDVEIVEALLLEVADEIGRFPKENTNKGKMKSIVHKIYHKYGLVRVIITGNDPLIGKKLNSSKRIWFEVDDDYDEVIVEHSWNSI